jgi:nickel-dependent lactate racemase
MQIELAYGKSGLRLELPEAWDVSVIEPKYLPGLPNPEAALQQALEAPLGCPPLKERVRPGMRVGIVFSDITRPAPHKLILPAVLEELESVPGVQVTLFNALGTHRPNTPDELLEMLGEELVERYRIVQNDAFERGTQTCLGSTTSGNEVWLNSELLDCDLKVLTGFIEPHMFAGFSGGGKALLPGMAGQSSVLNNHRASLIADRQATWGVTQGNPIYAEIQEAAGMAGETFLVNVTLNKHKQITGVFAGELKAAHAAGCIFARESAMVGVAEPFDIVLTSNSGYPLDLNLYQAVKGMSAAAQVVRPGGAIIMAAECWDGIPEHGQYAQLLREAASPEALLEMIMSTPPGQDHWEAQIQAQVQRKAEVYLYSTNLSEAQVREALLEPCGEIGERLEALVGKYGGEARICVLPEGPMTIAYVSYKL